METHIRIFRPRRDPTSYDAPRKRHAGFAATLMGTLLAVAGIAGLADAQTFPSTLASTATVTPPGGVTDPDQTNNTATDSNALALQSANLSVVKTLLTATPAPIGSEVRYQIVINNSGPAAATGVTVSDTLPSQLTNPAWTCSASGTDTQCGSAGGSGDINITVDVAVGGVVTLVVTGTAPATTPSTIGANTATLSLPPDLTDPDPSDNTSTVDPIPVQATDIQANDDSAGPVDGVSGASNVVNVLSNDTFNGVTATLPQVTLTPTSTAEIVINADGSVDVPAGTAPGTYTTTYQICDTANPTSCDDATVTVTVAAVIDAVDDSAGPINGVSGANNVVNVLNNDTFNGAAATLAQVALTSTSTAQIIINADGSVDVPAGTAPGTYSTTYQICDTANPTHCDTATVTITIASAIDAIDDNGGPVNGSIGATGILNVLTNDTFNGAAATLAQVTLTPTSTAQIVINADGSVDVPAGTTPGTYSTTYQICDTADPSNCDTASVTIVVDPATPIDAVDDNGGPVNGSIGVTGILNVLNNDTFNGATATLAQVTLTSTSTAQIVINADGSVDVPAGTTAGTYSTTYQICDTADPSNCDTATVTVIVSAGALDAVDDSAGPVDGATGGIHIVNVLANDTFNGSAATLSQVSLTPTNTAQITINPDGSVDVAAGTAAGTYTTTYQICEQANPANCDTATVTVTVEAATVDAVDDNAGPVNGSTGGNNVTNVLNNDTLDGSPVTASQVTLTPTNTAQITINPDGSVDVAAGIAAGTYTASYQICEVLNPANCDTATVTITVEAATVDAVDDNAGPVNGSTGGNNVTNVLNNDTLDGSPVTASQVTLTPTNTAQITINPDGSVDVASGIAAGTYTANYQICEVLNPANCDTATVTITVEAATVDAVDDNAGPVNGSTGGNNVTNVLNNDTLDGSPVTASQVTLTPTNTAQITINPDGSVDVAAGIAAGTYTTSYQICEVLNPANCDTATVTVTVTATAVPVQAEADVRQIRQNNPVSVNVLDNDHFGPTLVRSQDVVFSHIGSPANGTVSVGADGMLTYLPNTNFSGTDSFEYTICSAQNRNDCSTATVTVMVLPNQLTVVDDQAQTTPSAPVTIPNSANDSATDAPLDPGSITVVSQPAHGTITCSQGSCVYTPDADFSGEDSFTYQICDMSTPAPVCGTATARITVTGTMDLRVSKQTAQRSAKVGDLVRYTVTIDNLGDVAANGVSLLDTPPTGFTLVQDSVQVDDTDDSGVLSGTSPIRIGGLDVTAGGSATVTYYLRVGAGVGPGVYSNHALMQDQNGNPISNEASSDIEVTGDPLLDESLIIGSVFVDLDGDGQQRAGERGLPGVRLGTVEGLLVETDAYGRFHLIGIDASGGPRGHNFVLKVDPATLPPGASFTTENPQARRITAGLPVRFDFGVRLPEGAQTQSTRPGAPAQAAALQLGDRLFADASPQLRPAYVGILDQIAEQLQQSPDRILILPAQGQESLAILRAITVRAALAERVPATQAESLRVDVATSPEPSRTLFSAGAGIAAGGALFEAGSDRIRAEYRAMLTTLSSMRSTGLTPTRVIEAPDEVDPAPSPLRQRRARALQAALGGTATAETERAASPSASLPPSSDVR